MLRGGASEFQKLARALAKDETGQATVEYVLIVCFAVGVSAAMTRAFISALDKGIQLFGGQLEKDLRTGRAALYVWKN